MPDDEALPTTYLMLAAGALAMIILMLQHQHGRATTEPDFNQEAEVKAELLHHMTQHLGREPTEAELVNEELILQMSQRLRAYLIHSIQYDFSSPSPGTTPQQSPTAKTEPDEEHDPNVKVNDSYVGHNRKLLPPNTEPLAPPARAAAAARGAAAAPPVPVPPFIPVITEHGTPVDGSTNGNGKKRTTRKEDHIDTAHKKKKNGSAGGKWRADGFIAPSQLGK